MSEDDHNERLTKSEQQIKGLRTSFSSMEEWVDKRFDKMDDDISKGNDKILTEMAALRKDQSSSRQVSWPLVVSILSVTFFLLLGGVRWAMVQQKIAAVNEATAEVHHSYQADGNDHIKSWNRRIVDRQWDAWKEHTDLALMSHKTDGELDALTDEVHRIEELNTKQSQHIIDLLKIVHAEQASNGVAHKWFADWLAAVDRQGTRDNNISVPELLKTHPPSP